MAFIEYRLDDPCPGYQFIAQPGWSTRIVSLANGKEKRNKNWVNAKHTFTLPMNNIPEIGFEILKACFMAVGGSANGFRVKDWTDYTAEQTLMTLAPSGSTPVQLSKRYVFGPVSYDRPITKPVAGTVKVFQAGAPKAGTVDAATGLFTPTSAWTPGAILTWSGEFDVPVRFNSDDLPMSLDNPDAFNGDVVLLEIDPFNT